MQGADAEGDYAEGEHAGGEHAEGDYTESQFEDFQIDCAIQEDIVEDLPLSVQIERQRALHKEDGQIEQLRALLENSKRMQSMAFWANSV